MDASHVPPVGRVVPVEFTGPFTGTAANRIWLPWNVPKNASLVYLFLCGAGAAGQSGPITADGTSAGAAGGASGGTGCLIIPACFLPSTIWFGLADGGAPAPSTPAATAPIASYISDSNGVTTAANLIMSVTGSAAAVPGIYAAFGQFTGMAGQAGAAGTSGFGGTAPNLAYGTAPFGGGTGGGFSSGNAPGGNITSTNLFVQPSSGGTSAAANRPGNNSVRNIYPRLAAGGTGGGTNGTLGGPGGNGAPGCGGGGGGYASTARALGGAGGPAFALAMAW